MNSWGLSTAVDLIGCNPETIRDPEAIGRYIRELVQVIDMVPYGPCIVERFGHDDKEGYSAVQLIETSCITAHFAEDTNKAYIDIFSCKEYDPEVAALFSMEFFEAIDCEYTPMVRK